MGEEQMTLTCHKKKQHIHIINLVGLFDMSESSETTGGQRSQPHPLNRSINIELSTLPR